MKLTINITKGRLQEVLKRYRQKRVSSSGVEMTTSANLNFCACVGPAGACPCIQKALGKSVEITETQISAKLFALLPDEDKQTINRLKQKALAIYLGQKCSIQPDKDTQE